MTADTADIVYGKWEVILVNLHLEDRVYFVTGGSRGIGKAIALNLLKEGASVSICSRHIFELEKIYDSVDVSLRSKLLISECDVRDDASVQKVIKNTLKHYGKLDGVAANAGFGTMGKVLSTSNEEWISQYEMKLFSVLNVAKAALPGLYDSSAGRIVIINGVTANIPDINMAAVSASRAAVKQVAQMLAADLASREICVNAVNLGVIETDRQIERYKNSGSAMSYAKWSRSEAERRQIPLGRFGTPGEVSSLVTFLLSPLASYITGSSIDVSGGMNARM